MDIKKQTEVMGRGVPTAAQLESINAQAKAKLTEEHILKVALIGALEDDLAVF